MKAIIPQSNYLTAYKSITNDSVRGSQKGKRVETHPTGSPNSNCHRQSCQWTESTSRNQLAPHRDKSAFAACSQHAR